MHRRTRATIDLDAIRHNFELADAQALIDSR